MSDDRLTPVRRIVRRIAAGDPDALGDYFSLRDFARQLERELAVLQYWDVRTWWASVRELGCAVSHEDGWTLIKTEDLERLEAVLRKLERIRTITQMGVGAGGFPADTTAEQRLEWIIKVIDDGGMVSVQSPLNASTKPIAGLTGAG